MNSPPGESSLRSAVPAVRRAAAILDAIMNRQGGPMSITELSSQLRIPKSSTLNLCNELVESRLLRRIDGRYQLGPKLATLGAVYLASVDVVREFQDICSARSAELQETIKLAVLGDRGELVFLARHDAARSPGILMDVRVQQPAHCTASGKAMLSLLSARGLEQWLDGRTNLVKLTPNSIGSADELRCQLEAVRDRCYATEDGECIEGVFCVGTAIGRAQDDEAIYGLSISMLRQRATRAHVARLAAELQSIGAELGKRLGDAYV